MGEKKTKLEAAKYELKVHEEWTEEQKEAFALVADARHKKADLEEEIARLEREAYGMERDEKYYCLQYDGSIRAYRWTFSYRDMAGADRGNVFKTEEAAKAEDARRIAAVEANRA